MRTYILTIVFISSALISVMGCGRVVNAAPSTATQVLSLTPSNLSVRTNQPAPITAVATDGNGSTQDMTQQVSWRTSSPAIIVSKGTATCNEAGTYTVTASTTMLSASASVTCIAVAIPKPIKGIQFVGAPATILSNAPASLAVQAIYDDGSVTDVTTQVSWTSDKVAYVSPKGIASCNAPGTATIVATLASISAKINVQCFIRHLASHAGFVEHSALFYGPFPSWLNLRTDFHAAGDGVTDDTAAFRAGIAAAKQQNRVLYIPNPDVYYILADTLHLKELDGVTIVGQDGLATHIMWAGAQKGTMLSYEGSTHMKLSRLWLDGSSREGVAISVDHQEGVPGQLYPTFDLLQDLTVSNLAIGATLGFAGETSFDRVHFDNVGTAVALKNWNALNVNLTDCLFTDNYTALSNEPGAGAFNVSHSVFVRSKYADMLIGNTGQFSLRDNISIDSQAIFVARGSAAAAAVTFEGNVIRGVKSVPFQFSDPSVLVLVGNTFEAPTDSQAALVLSQGSLPMQILANDNHYSSNHPYQGNLGNVQIINEQPQANVPLSAMTIPDSVYMPPSSGKPVFEIPSQATGATIQQIVADAGSLVDGAVVHFSGAQGTNATIEVPDNPNLALVGDGFMSTLYDGGIPHGGPVLRTHGSAKIEDLLIVASRGGGGIQVLLDDQPSSRFLCDFCTTFNDVNASVSVTGLDNAKVNFRSSQMNGVYGFAVSGGSNQMAGRTGLSSVNAFMTTSNTFTVGHNGHFLISDGFHDGGQPPVLGQITDGAVVTYDGGLINSSQGLLLKAFTGVASFLGVQVNGPVAGDNASSGSLGMVGTLNLNTSLKIGPGTSVVQASAYTYKPVQDTGLMPMPMNAAAISDVERLFAQARTEDVLPRQAGVIAAQVVHLRRVAVSFGAVAFAIGPNPALTSTTTYVVTDPNNASNTPSTCGAGTVSLNGTWTLDPGDDGFYGLKGSLGYLGNVLPSGGGDGQLALTARMTDAGQRWLIEAAGDGTFTITNRADGNRLTRTPDGCAAVATPSGSTSQKWAVSGAAV